MLLLVYPRDYFDSKTVDKDMQTEYAAACATGLFDVALFNYDQWLAGEALRFSQLPQAASTAVYRGWMLKPEQYRKLYGALQERGVRLVTSPECYERFHLFPNIYDDIKEDTARTLIYPDGQKVDVKEVQRQFPRFMVKDYVKSVKGTEFPRFFDGSIKQTEFDECMNMFYKYRGALYTGGLCIKEYLDLRRYEKNTNEFRVFYIRNEVGTISRNSLQGEYTPEPPKALIQKYKRLGSLFYTIDYAELTDGSWKIIEAGDGQVSGLSDGQDAEFFYRTLHQAFGQD